ncbi:MAG: CheR family methyltransferase [Myxococcota bacterium]
MSRTTCTCSSSVSSFYRYPRAFDLLRERVIPELASQRESLRVWSAGCGKGEEAYTLALLLEEAEVSGRVEATDLDEKALALARKGLYRHSSTKMLPEDLYRSYLQPVSSNGKTRLSPTAETRRRVRFSKGDLTSSNPAPGGGEFDLVLCRNVLIYLGREAQESMLQALARSVRPGGYLCLGEAEWLVTAEDLFEIVDSAARIFRRGSHEQE